MTPVGGHVLEGNAEASGLAGLQRGSSLADGVRSLPQDYLVEHVDELHFHLDTADRPFTSIRDSSVKIGDGVPEKILRGAHPRICHDKLAKVASLFLVQCGGGNGGRGPTLLEHHNRRNKHGESHRCQHDPS